MFHVYLTVVLDDVKILPVGGLSVFNIALRLDACKY